MKDKDRKIFRKFIVRILKNQMRDAMYLVVHVCSCDNVIRISELISRYKKQDLIFPLLNILLVSEKYIFLRIHGLGSLKCIGIWDFLVQVSELPSI